MPRSRSVRDSDLLDALEAIQPEPYEGPSWRVVRESRDPLICSSAGGRWDDATFDVLYTSTARDGAIAEMHFHLSRGLPVMPSKLRYWVFELTVSLRRMLHMPSLASLMALGLDTARYGQLSYQERQQEYSRTQDIAEAAHFLEFDGLMVPSARWDCTNIVVFCDRVPPEALAVAKDHGLINWAAWRSAERD